MHTCVCVYITYNILSPSEINQDSVDISPALQVGNLATRLAHVGAAKNAYLALGYLLRTKKKSFDWPFGGHLDLFFLHCESSPRLLSHSPSFDIMYKGLYRYFESPYPGIRHSQKITQLRIGPVEFPFRANDEWLGAPRMRTGPNFCLHPHGAAWRSRQGPNNHRVRRNAATKELVSQSALVWPSGSARMAFVHLSFKTVQNQHRNPVYYHGFRRRLSCPKSAMFGFDGSFNWQVCWCPGLWGQDC